MEQHQGVQEALAVVWLAHDADVSQEDARKIIAKHRAEEHSGDCRKEPWTCMRCCVNDAMKAGRELYDAINASGTHRVVSVAETLKAVERIADRLTEALDDD